MVKMNMAEYKTCTEQDFDEKEENGIVKNGQDVQSEENSYEHDTTCGIANFRPKWIQIFASKKMYSIAYGIFGLVLYGEMSSFQGNITSLEKNFSLSAKIVGSLKTVNNAASVIGNFTCYAADKGNKIRWLSFATFIFFVGCIICIIPIFTPISLQNINAHSSSEFQGEISARISNKENTCEIGNENYNFSRNLIILPFVTSQFLFGFAMAFHRSCGAAYMDDNIRKNVFPVWYAAIYSTQWFGYALALIITSFALKFYVFPTYTPNITNTDPRWIGAWWFGPVLFGGVGLLLLPIFLLFPRSLPRAAMRRQKKIKTEERSWKDFFKTLKSILGNKILMMETISTTIFSLGLYSTLWPKYIEIQYGMTSSKSNLMQGFIEFVARPFGMLVTSILIVKVKPRPRVLLGWHVILTCTAFAAFIGLIFTTCEKATIRGHMDERNNWILTEACNDHYNCSANLKYAPVCDRLQNQLFFSNCHAGCQSVLLKDNRTLFNRCDCAPNSDYLEEGVCRTNCAVSFTAYVLLLGLIKVLKASQRSIKAVVEFRAMKETEKSFSIGVMRSIQSLFSTMPAMIIYGSLIDASCLVWDNKCGAKGNCWLYDTDKLRYMFFITSSVFIGICIIMDILLCINVKSLKLYDEDFTENPSQSDKGTQSDNGLQQMLLMKS